CLLSCSFVFSCHRHTRDLHSFPTRRSSDLGTDSGIPGNFHTDSTWRELATWVRLGMTPMQAIAGATRWPAVFLKKEKDIGTLARSEEHTSELQSRGHLVCRLLLEKKNTKVT